MKSLSIILAGIVSISCFTMATAAPIQQTSVGSNQTANIALGFEGKCRIVNLTNDKVFYNDFNAKSLKTANAAPMQWRIISSNKGEPKLIEAISKPAISFVYNKRPLEFAENSYNMQCVKY